MRLTEKSQVTIPKQVRDHLGIGPGSEVDFRIEGNSVRLVRKEPDPDEESAGERLVRVLRKAGESLTRSSLSAEEIIDISRGPFDDVDAR